MFCVLSVRERNRTIFERIFGKLLTDDYSVKTIPVYKGAPFFSLDITTSKKEINWEDVIFAVGKCASRLVLNGDVRLPENLNINIFRSKALYNKMLNNTFLQILENNNDRMYQISLMDENAENTDFSRRLSEYASSLCICTKDKEKYIPVCDEITEVTGMCPVLKSHFADSEIKINTDKGTMTIFNNNENINISSGVDFTVPSAYENLLPGGVDKYDFYSALYELCGVFSLGEGIFNIITVNNEKKSVQDILFS